MDALAAVAAVGLVVWIVFYLLSLAPLTEPAGTILRLIVGMVLLLWVVMRFRLI